MRVGEGHEQERGEGMVGDGEGLESVGLLELDVMVG